MARNKKFEKLGVNEKYAEHNTESVSAEKEKKKSSVVSFLKTKIKAQEKHINTHMETYSDSENAPAEKYTYTKHKRASSGKNKSVTEVHQAPKAPIILLLCCLCLSLAGAFLLNADFVYSMRHPVQNGIKIAVSVCVYVIPAIIYVLWNKGHICNIKKCSVKYAPFVAVCLGLLLCASALQKYLIAYVFSYRVPVGVQQDGLLVTILAGALIPAFCEELLVRGVMQYEFSKYAGGFGGVLFASLAFTLLHFDLQFFGVYFVAGIVLGVVTHVTGSVYPAMIIHFLNNTFSIALSDRLTFVAIERIGGTLLIIVLAACCFILLAIMLQMMEKISMHRAVLYLKGTEKNKEDENEKGIYSGQAKEDVQLFVSLEGNTLTKTAKLLVNRISLVCYAVFLVVVIISL